MYFFMNEKAIVVNNLVKWLFFIVTGDWALHAFLVRIEYMNIL